MKSHCTAVRNIAIISVVERADKGWAAHFHMKLQLAY
jgi:hypothetical protein